MSGYAAEVWLLGVVATLDAGFAGYRASLGRTGRWLRLGEHLVAALRGLAAGALLTAAPVVAGVLLVDTAVANSAAAVMLTAVAPLALAVLPALLVWWLLPWRWAYLASAVVLGPGTWLRPVVAAAAALGVVVLGHPPLICVLAAACAVALLLVEPIVGSIWYRVHDPLTALVDAARGR